MRWIGKWGSPVVLSFGFDPMRWVDFHVNLVAVRRWPDELSPMAIVKWFSIYFGVMRPRIYRVFDHASRNPGDIISARWTGRQYQIVGWTGGVWLRVEIMGREWSVAFGRLQHA